jgi:hypothetical protein
MTLMYIFINRIVFCNEIWKADTYLCMRNVLFIYNIYNQSSMTSCASAVSGVRAVLIEPPFRERSRAGLLNGLIDDMLYASFSFPTTSRFLGNFL